MALSLSVLDLSRTSSRVPSPSFFLPVLPRRWMVRISDDTGS